MTDSSLSVALYGAFDEHPTGPSRVTTGLSTALADRGHDIEIITNGTATSHPHDRVSVTNVPIEPGSVFNFWRIHRWVSRHVARGDYNLFHAVAGYSYPADVNTVQGAFTELDLLRQRAPAVPPLRTLLGGLIYSVMKAHGIYRSSSIVTTSPVSDRQLSTYLRCQSDEMIPLGIEESRLSEPSPSETPLRVLFVGRIEPIKGQYRVLQYLSPDSPDYSVDIVGGITDESYYRKFSDAWSDRVHGHVDDDRLQEFYHDSDVVIMPSHHETFGLVGLEAIANGCLVVATDTCGFALLPQMTSENGVFTVSDGRKAADTIRELTTRDDLDARKRAAFETAQGLTWRSVAETYEDVYRSTIAARD